MRPSTCPERRASVAGAAALLLGCAVLAAGAARAAEGDAAAGELDVFKAWLDTSHHGYGCDEGPARFRNETVEAAYPGRHFYYVLTHARGIPPPFANALSLVAEVRAGGEVRPLNHGTPATLREGLMKVRRTDDARQAAAAVLVLTLGDPGERRWPVRPGSVTVKKSRNGWLCTCSHGDESHPSRVTFDRDGLLTGVECNTPPVP